MEEMNYTTILKKGESLLLWIYKNITNKFTGAFKKLQDRFPILNKYPLLKYSLIPLFIALFLMLRYIIKFVMNELAAWISGFVGETTSYSISESAIVISIAALFIISRIGLRLWSQKK